MAAEAFEPNSATESIDEEARKPKSTAASNAAARSTNMFFAFFVGVVLVVTLALLGVTMAKQTGMLRMPSAIGFITEHALLNPSQAARDAGGFAGSYDYGGWDDWSYNYSSDWDSNYSWDWSDDYDYDWDWDDYSYSGSGDYGYYYGSGSSYSDSDDFVDLIVAIFIMFMIVRFIRNTLGSGGRSSRTNPARASTDSRKPRTSSTPKGATRTADSKLRSLSALKQRDPLFDESDIEMRIANVYVQMQHAWTAGDFSPMRPYFTNALYAQFERQLGELRRKNCTNYVENIAVLESTVRGWYESKDSEYLVMRVRTRITDYVLNDRTGAVVNGSRTAESFMEYEYILERPIGTQSHTQEKQIDVFECPNCGAPVNIAQSAKCPYCGSVLESAKHTWVIFAIKGISQHIVG